MGHYEDDYEYEYLKQHGWLEGSKYDSKVYMQREKKLPEEKYDFVADVKKMNETYGRETFQYPHMYPNAKERILNFTKILQDEVDEGIDIIALHKAGLNLEALVATADWLGDLIVYCTSEMLKYGLPVNEILQIIMESNGSKLGEDGKPLIDEQTGKILKGPNYWKPEPKIRKLIMAKWLGDGEGTGK